MADEKPTRHAHNFKDLTGRRFGRLVIASFNARINRTTMWNCRCDCGKERIISGHDIVRGATKSCGCYMREVAGQLGRTHGKSRSPEHFVWISAKQRCFNPKNPAYPNYGGRGITMCDEWRDSFERFLEDMGPRPAGTSLDRIDNSVGYCKSNCRWANRATQNNNTRRSVHALYRGELLPLRIIALRSGVPYSTLCRWNRGGIPIE